MLKKIKNSFQLISYLLITYFLAKLFKTDYMAIKEKRAKIKVLLGKKEKVEARYEDLKKNNIRGERTALKNEANKIYKSYIHNKNKKLPFVIGKLAVSKDNFIFSKNKNRITNRYSDNITQLLRYKNDAILISSKTLNIDNPKLNCRIRGLSKHSPRRVILDKNLSTKQTSYIFKTSNRKNTIIIYSNGTKKKINQFKKNGVKLIKLVKIGRAHV